MDPIDTAKTHAIDLNLQRPHALGRERFRIAIEQ